MNKSDKIWLFIASIIIFSILAISNKIETTQNDKSFVDNLPTEMVEYISTKISSNDNKAIKQYYLQNFNQLEDLAYEYSWY